MRTSACALAVATLLCPAPAAAQDSPTFALSDVPWSLPEGRTRDPRFVHVWTQQLPPGSKRTPRRATYTLAADWMEVERAGDGALTLRTSPTLTLTIDRGEDYSLPLSIEVPGNVVSFDRADGSTAVEAKAESLLVTPRPPDGLPRGNGAVVSEGRTGALSFSMTTGPLGSLEPAELWGALRDGDGSYRYALEKLEVAFEPSEARRRKAEAPERGRRRPMLTGGKLVVDGATGRGTLAGSRLIDAQRIEGLRVQLAEPGPYEVGIASLATDVETPLPFYERPQDVRYDVTLRDISANEALWARLDPKDRLEHGIDRIALRLFMRLRELPGEGEDGAAQLSALVLLVPFDFVLEELAFDGVGLRLRASGEGNLSDSAEGEGVVEIEGLRDFLRNLAATGAVSPMHAVVAQGVAAQYGEARGDGVAFDIEGSDGTLRVNGRQVLPRPVSP